ncbi:hypothetical protein HOU02_gp322 [Caulobacter phage CcrBL9]|uniref:Uncharacterized protein n=1 Tax=Caulobacter phage CcrBL9 TaxID=2283270 RepID=A0A385ECA1_9CAUD|nr:hypothetical protein HOU02_gp322 [Caulobacter phage CcrBL9]AXQ69403.1 hypothetical protein CcrBL9_gp379 [Caulobacter phage CcrBL9]
MEWRDEPGAWKDVEPLNPALSSSFQLAALVEEGMVSVRRYGDLKYLPNFRIATYEPRI